MSERETFEYSYEGEFRKGMVEGLETALLILQEAREGDRDGDFRSLIFALEQIKKAYK